MKHPTQATLALHAGGDLGTFSGWRVERHLARCERCRAEVAAFEGVREMLPELAELPEIQWNRLAGEMKANIRLGLAAGECVRTAETPSFSPRLSWGRAAVALASISALMITGLLVERPMPMLAQDDRAVVETMGNGIEIRGKGRSLRMLTPERTDVKVLYTVGAQGTMGARYVDPQTGYVTINKVYAD